MGISFKFPLTQIFKLIRVSALTGLILSVSPIACADTVGNSSQSPIYRALHPETSLDEQIVTFHFGSDTFNVPRNYLTGGSDVPRQNEPGFFSIQVLLPDLEPRTRENQDKFLQTTPGLGNVIRVSVHSSEHLLPIKDAIDRIIHNKESLKNYYITHTGLKKYKTFTEDIYIKQNDNLEDIFFASCMGDIQTAPGKSCTVYEQYNENIALYYFVDKKFAEDSYEIDEKVRALIRSFEKK
jgi:hypothetical protein